jgi:hypothetical protein
MSTTSTSTQVGTIISVSRQSKGETSTTAFAVFLPPISGQANSLQGFSTYAVTGSQPKTANTVPAAGPQLAYEVKRIQGTARLESRIHMD